jgi:26S proteasome regulatory subunit N7
MAETKGESKAELDGAYMEIAQLRFALGCAHLPDAEKSRMKEQLLAHIKAKEMAPFYKSTCAMLGWPTDEVWLGAMEAANQAELDSLVEKLSNAEQNEGESEICAALLARAEFNMRIGEKQKTIEAFEETYAKTVGLGPKLDLLLSKLRVCLFIEDVKLVSSTIQRAKGLLEEGGDWERRNRLKVYEAVFLMSIRDFKRASTLLLDSIATFTATELLSYNTFVMYTVFTSVLALPRAELKAKVIDAPEILQVIDEVPHLTELLDGLYNCEYKKLLRALVNIVDALQIDRYLHSHARFYWREVRVLAYTQFLESYRSVSLSSMANSFGVSSDFLDKELAGFIAAERLCCKIDKVNGVVSSTRPDTKNAQYQTTIKQGDLLLNRLQKLSRVINV